MMLVWPGSPELLILLAIGPSQLHATTACPMQPSEEQRATSIERRTRDAVMDLLRCEFARTRLTCVRQILTSTQRE